MHVRIHWVVIPLMLLGAVGFSYTDYVHDASIRSSRPEQIRQENQRIRKTMASLGNHDNGEADLTYYRNGHILSFEVTNYNFKGKFTGTNLQRQIAYFKRNTQLHSVSPQVQMTKGALRHHQVQVAEQKKQRKENHREAQEALKQAKQKAKQQAEKAKEKALAKRKAKERKAKQEAQARKRAQQRAEELRQKRAKQQDEAKKNSRQKNKKDTPPSKQ